MNQKNDDKLAYYGEQVLSFIDDIVKTPCPKCGISDLSIGFIGKTLIIKCSDASITDEEDAKAVIAYYKTEANRSALKLCKFIKAVRLTKLDSGPFILKFADDRPKVATQQNKTRARRVRSKTS